MARRGFTLIEFCVVFCVVAILVAVISMIVAGVRGHLADTAIQKQIPTGATKVFLLPDNAVVYEFQHKGHLYLVAKSAERHDLGGMCHAESCSCRLPAEKTE